MASAFGTVGTSHGATGALDHLGRLVICFVMFVGRVGPPTLGCFPATRVAPRVRYPSSPIYPGRGQRAPSSAATSIATVAASPTPQTSERHGTQPNA